MNDTEVQIEAEKIRQADKGDVNQQETRRYRGGKLSIIVIVAAIGWFLYLLYWPFTVTHLDKIIISTDPIMAGQYQRYTAESCHEPGVEGEVVRNIVLQGTDEAPISSTRVPVRPIECSNIILIPENLPNGTYEVTLHIIYRVNPIRDALNPIIRDFRSNPFLVEGGVDVEIPSNIPAGKTPDNADRDVNTPAEASSRQPEATAQTNPSPSTNPPARPAPQPTPRPTTPDETEEPEQPTASRPLVPVVPLVEGLVDTTTGLTCNTLGLICR